jgi:hypothetical protein
LGRGVAKTDFRCVYTIRTPSARSLVKVHH